MRYWLNVAQGIYITISSESVYCFRIVCLFLLVIARLVMSVGAYHVMFNVFLHRPT